MRSPIKKTLETKLTIIIDMGVGGKAKRHQNKVGLSYHLVDAEIISREMKKISVRFKIPKKEI